MNPASQFLSIFGEKITRFPKIFTLLTLALTLLLSYGATRLDVEGSVGNIFNPESEYVTEYENFIDNFASLEREILIVVESDDVLSATTRNEISDFHLELEFLDNVERVISIASLRDSPAILGNMGQLIADGNFDKFGKDVIFEKLYEHPMARHRLISEDHKKSLIIVDLKPRSQISSSLAET